MPAIKVLALEFGTLGKRQGVLGSQIGCYRVLSLCKMSKS